MVEPLSSVSRFSMRLFIHSILAAVVLAAVLYGREFQPQILAFLQVSVGDEAVSGLLSKTLDVLAWFCGVWFLNTLIRGVFWDGIVRHSFGRPTPLLLKQVSDLVVAFAGLLIVVRVVFDESIMAFVTALSALGVAAAFGVRGLVSDIATGLAINLEPPFQIGDWVLIYDAEAGKFTGQVVEINWRTTHIRSDNNNYHIIPNREIGNSTVINFWRSDHVNRFEIPVIIDYAVATDEAKRILLAAASAVTGNSGFVANPAPQVVVSGLGENGVEYLVRYWIKPWEGVSPTAAADIVHSSILRHLRLADITPAYRKLEYFQEPKPEGLQVGTETRLAASMRKLLHLVDILSPLNEVELQTVIASSKQSLWQAGDTLMKQGEYGDSMFIVLQGLLEIWRTQENREETLVARIEPGECFGEMSLLTGETRAATVRAATPVFTFEITKEVMEQLIRARPELALKISEIVAARQIGLEQARLGHENAIASRSQRTLAAHLYDRMRAFIAKG